MAQSNSTLWLSVSKSSSFREKKKRKKKKKVEVGEEEKRKQGTSKEFFYTPAISEVFPEWLLISPSCAFGATLAGFGRSFRVALENQLLLGEWGRGGRGGGVMAWKHVKR